MNWAIRPRDGCDQLASILEEVEVPPALLYPIIDRAAFTAFWAQNSLMAPVLHLDLQFRRIACETACSHSPPAVAQLQSRLKQLIRSHAEDSIGTTLISEVWTLRIPLSVHREAAKRSAEQFPPSLRGGERQGFGGSAPIKSVRQHCGLPT